MPGEKEKAKKDKFQKVLKDYGQAMKVFHKGDYKKAAEMLNSFLEKEDKENELSDRARMYLRVCQSHLEKKSVTLKTFDDYYDNGLQKLNRGEYEDALISLTKATELDPKIGKAAFLLATVYIRMDKQKESLDYLKKAIQLDESLAVLAQNETDFELFKDDKNFKLITGME